MSIATRATRLPRFALLAAAGALALASASALACEFDGQVHGYGPDAALLAGMPSYHALDGRVAETDAIAGIASLDPPAPARPPTRSFARWARTAPPPMSGTPTPGSDAPARWLAPPAGTPQPSRRSLPRDADAGVPRGGSVP